MSLPCYDALLTWLVSSDQHIIHLWHVPMSYGFTPLARCHAEAVSLSVRGEGRISLDARRRRSTDHCLVEWRHMFTHPKYIGGNFLHLKNGQGKFLVPSHLNGGPWLQLAQRSPPLFARVCRAISNHAPIGEYRNRFPPRDDAPTISC